MQQLNVFNLPELLENIFSFLAKDKALYPTLFVNHLWYHCSSPILWRGIEFFIENCRQNPHGKNISQALYWRLLKFKRIMCGGIMPFYFSEMIYLRLEGLKISDVLISTI